MLQILIQGMLVVLLSPPKTAAKQQTIELFDTAVCKIVPDYSLSLSVTVTLSLRLAVRLSCRSAHSLPVPSPTELPHRRSGCPSHQAPGLL